MAAEIGHRWSVLAWRLWLRAGVLYASGDEDPVARHHGTFFQMFPTVRRYSQSMTYAQMNTRDVFVQAYLYPHARVSWRADLRAIDLAQRQDRWYAGSGATARKGTEFGYAGRLSHDATGLGVVLDQSVDLRLHRRWSVNAYVGTFWGGDVVRRSFLGDRLTFTYVENVLTF